MKKAFAFIISLSAICALMCGCSQNSVEDPLQGYEKVSMHASWAYNYGGVKGLCETDELDLVARVKIGEGIQDNKSGIMTTVFTATVEDLIYGSGEETVNVVMTGGVDHKEKTIFEISDDPLMQNGDEFIIFARKNESGTYTVLGGPQGRFVIDNDLVYPMSSCSSQAMQINDSADATGKNIDDFIREVKSYI